MVRVHLVGLLTLAAMILSVGQVLAAETLPGEPEIETRMEAAREQAPPVDEPLATGRVVSVDGAAGRITLEYRPIPQLFLDGGTRIFQVRDPASLKGLGAGSKVRFEVERHGRTYIVTRIENSN